jgi:Fe2+ or Zn2+ uptake regulation protein
VLKIAKKIKNIPIDTEIINILIKNRGEILSTDLYRQLSLTYKDITRAEMQDVLFRLEVRSFIHVSIIKKDVSKIEISRHGAFSDSVYREIRTFLH